MLAKTGASGVSTHGMSWARGGNRFVGTTDSEPASGSVTYRLSSAGFSTIRARSPWKLPWSTRPTPNRPERSGRLTAPTWVPSTGSMRRIVFGREPSTYTEPLSSEAAMAAGSAGRTYFETLRATGSITASSWVAVLIAYARPRDVATPARPTPVTDRRAVTWLLGPSITVT